MAGLLQEELSTPKKIYSETFKKILFSRGIINREQIEKANCTLVLETDEKEILEVPNQLKLLINQVFHGAKNINVKKVSLSEYLGIIEIELGPNSTWKQSKDKSFLIPFEQNSKYTAFGTVLIFDFQNLKLRKPCVIENGNKTNLVWEFISIPQSIIAEFVKFLAIIDLKPYSKVSIYRSGEPELPDSFLKVTTRKRRFRRRFLRKRYKL